jgi:DNA end-binding protein Ku
LHTAARGETISFNQLHKDDHSRVKQVLYCQAEDKPISRDQIVKGYEYEKGKYVVVEDEEIKKVAPKTAKVMELLEFVKSADVDAVYLDSSYYLAPDEGGEKPYALLFEALKKTGYYGIAKVAMHNREHIVVIRPAGRGLMLHTMFYADEVRRTDAFSADTTNVQEKELKLAQMLVESLAAEFEPEKYHDTYRDNLRKMIEARIEGRAVVETPEASLAPVIDIMEALKKSLEMRKPPQVASEVASEATVSETETAPRRKRAGGRRTASA